MHKILAAALGAALLVFAACSGQDEGSSKGFEPANPYATQLEVMNKAKDLSQDMAEREALRLEQEKLMEEGAAPGSR
ncbi:MAG: hypothetical protein QMD09_08055 [Desulfatibacillaceae bacterium]|nr:hypothetical protein [Desulfatibacillaceae bacterium]